MSITIRTNHTYTVNTNQLVIATRKAEFYDLYIVQLNGKIVTKLQRTKTLKRGMLKSLAAKCEKAKSYSEQASINKVISMLTDLRTHTK
jgi:hypothetical protein